MTTTTRNKQLVEEAVAAVFTDGDLTAVDRYLHPDFIDHDPPPCAPDGPVGASGSCATPPSLS